MECRAFREEKLTPAAALYLAKQSKEDQKDLVQKEFFTVAAMEGYKLVAKTHRLACGMKATKLLVSIHLYERIF